MARRPEQTGIAPSTLQLVDELYRPDKTFETISFPASIFFMSNRELRGAAKAGQTRTGWKLLQLQQHQVVLLAINQNIFCTVVNYVSGVFFC